MLWSFSINLARKIGGKCRPDFSDFAKDATSVDSGGPIGQNFTISNFLRHAPRQRWAD
jgi:hypothetical protein